VKTILLYIFVSSGGLLTGLGAVSVGMYIWEAIISRLGDSDQSLIFWYLPFLFVGVMGILGGLFIVRIGLSKIRGIKQEIQ
jgi:hypothetical protein